MKYKISIYKAIDDVRQVFSLPEAQEPVFVVLNEYTDGRGTWWRIKFKIVLNKEILYLTAEVNANTGEIIKEEAHL